jgi:riboflavin kinase / FMN adenylyltransferase
MPEAHLTEPSSQRLRGGLQAAGGGGARPAPPPGAAVSIGTNPTFSGRERRVEPFLLDFEGDLYGERLALDFVAYLREMRTYDAVEPLLAQIEEDIARTREVLPH